MIARDIDELAIKLEEAVALLFQAEEIAKKARNLVGIVSRTLVMKYREDAKRKKR